MIRLPRGTIVTVLTIDGEKIVGTLAWTYRGQRDNAALAVTNGTYTIPSWRIVALEVSQAHD